MMDGKKFDNGKLQWSLLPWSGLKGAVRVLEMGAKKYSRNNWKEVPEAKIRYLDALLRHVAAMQDGDGIDPESGLPHIDHVVCNAMFLAHFEAESGGDTKVDTVEYECLKCVHNARRINTEPNCLKGVWTPGMRTCNNYVERKSVDCSTCIHNPHDGRNTCAEGYVIPDDPATGFCGDWRGK